MAHLDLFFISFFLSYWSLMVSNANCTITFSVQLIVSEQINLIAEARKKSPICNAGMIIAVSALAESCTYAFSEIAGNFRKTRTEVIQKTWAPFGASI